MLSRLKSGVVRALELGRPLITRLVFEVVYAPFTIEDEIFIFAFEFLWCYMNFKLRAFIGC